MCYVFACWDPNQLRCRRRWRVFWGAARLSNLERTSADKARWTDIWGSDAVARGRPRRAAERERCVRPPVLPVSRYVIPVWDFLTVDPRGGGDCNGEKPSQTRAITSRRERGIRIGGISGAVRTHAMTKIPPERVHACQRTVHHVNIPVEALRIRAVVTPPYGSGESHRPWAFAYWRNWAWSVSVSES